MFASDRLAAISRAPLHVRGWQLWTTAIVGLVVTGVLVTLSFRFVLEDESLAFGGQSNRLVDAIANRAVALDASARGFQALLHSVDRIDGDQFRAFSDDLLTRYSFVVGTAFHPRVSQTERAAFEASEGAGHFQAGIVDEVVARGSDYTLRRAEPRTQYYPLLFKDLATEDRAVLGLDRLASPDGARSIAAAVEHGTPVLTHVRPSLDGGLELDVLVATYAGKRTPTQRADRRLTADGIVAITIDLRQLLGTELLGPAHESPPLRGTAAIVALAKLASSGDDVSPIVAPSRLPRLRGSLRLQAGPRQVFDADVHYRFRSEVPTPDVADQPLLIADETTSSAGMRLGELSFVREFEFADRSVHVALVRPLDVGQLPWALSLAALVNGFGFTWLALRVVRSAMVQQVMNELLAAKNEQIHRINAGLEEIVAARTADLSAVNAEIEEMLDNLDDAVVIVDAQGLILDRYSPATREILGLEEPAGVAIDSLLTAELEAGEPTAATHCAAFGFVFGGDDLQWDMSVPEFLTTIRYRHPQRRGDDAMRTLQVKYAPLYDEGGRVGRVLIVLSDVTEMLALRQQAREHAAATDATVAALKDLVNVPREDLRPFLDDTRARLERAQAAVEGPEAAELEVLARELHTIKGNARALGLAALSTSAHELESALATAHHASSLGSLPTLLRGFVAQVDHYETTTQRYLATTAAAGSWNVDLVRHVDALSSNFARPAQRKAHVHALIRLARAVRSAEVMSLSRLFYSYEASLEATAQQLDKSLHPLEIHGPFDDVYFHVSLQEPLREVLTHVLNNCIDHGIEQTEERRARGKPAAGSIALILRPLAAAVELVVCDDGAGIDAAALRATASEPVADPFERAFAPGVSSKRSVTELSGRGVGLAAVRSALAALSIDCALRPAEPHGTEFVLRIPNPYIVAFVRGAQLSGPDSAEGGMVAAG